MPLAFMSSIQLSESLITGFCGPSMATADSRAAANVAVLGQHARSILICSSDEVRITAD